MIKKCLRWTWLNRKKTAGLVALILFVLMNAFAYIHARAMTRFSTTGARTGSPERLSWGQKLRVIACGVTIPRPTNETTPASLSLDYEVHHFPSRDGLNLEGWFIPHSSPKGVVALFHGYSASKTQLLREAQAFHDMGYAVMLVDFRGSGGSAGDETTVGVREADDVAGASDYIRSHWPDQSLILFGHSMGSVAVLRALANDEVHPAAIVLECPFDTLLHTVEHRFASMGMPSFPLAGLLVFWGGVQQGFNGFNHNAIDYAESVSCPTLMLHGARDVRVTEAEARAVFDRLVGPKEMHLLPNVGHDAYATLAPGVWKGHVQHFLAIQLANYSQSEK